MQAVIAQCKHIKIFMMKSKNKMKETGDVPLLCGFEPGAALDSLGTANPSIIFFNHYIN